MPLQGVDDLRRRLQAVARVGDDVESEWADVAARTIADATPVRTGQTRSTVRADGAGRVVGSSVVNILDRGTRGYEIDSRGKTLRWQQGTTVKFAKRVHKPPMAGRHFVTDAAENAVDEVVENAVVDAWNGAA